MAAKMAAKVIKMCIYTVMMVVIVFNILKITHNDRRYIKTAFFSLTNIYESIFNPKWPPKWPPKYEKMRLYTLMMVTIAFKHSQKFTY